MNNQLRNNSTTSYFKQAIDTSFGSIESHEIISSKSKIWAKLRSKSYRIKLAPVPVSPTSIQLIAPDFQVEHGPLYYQPETGYYIPQFIDSDTDRNSSLRTSFGSSMTSVSSAKPESLSTESTSISIIQNSTASVALTEVVTCAVEQENNYHDSSLTSSESKEIDISPLAELNVSSSSKLNIATICNEPINLEAAVIVELPTKSPSAVTGLQPLISETETSSMEQSPRMASLKLSQLDRFAKFRSDIRAIYELSTSNHSELADKLFSLFNGIYNSPLDSDDFVYAVAYWLHYDRNFNVEESIWREYALENDEILFTVSSFLNDKADNEDCSHIKVVLSFLAIITNHKIVSCGYQITGALMQLSMIAHYTRIANYPVIALINDIFSNVMPYGSIPPNVIETLRHIPPEFTPKKYARIYKRIIKGYLQESEDDVMKSAAGVVSFLARTPASFMMKGRDLFGEAILKCLEYKDFEGRKTFRASHWLAAALKHPSIYHRFSKYFSRYVSNDDPLLGSPVLKMFEYMRSYLIFSAEFKLVPLILDLYRIQPDDEQDNYFFKLLTQEEVSYCLAMESIAPNVVDNTAITPNYLNYEAYEGRHIDNNIRVKKSVTWRSNIVSCPNYNNTINTGESRQAKFENITPENIAPTFNNENNHYKETLADEMLLTRVNEINAAEIAFIHYREKRQGNWAKGFFTTLPFCIEHAFKQKAQAARKRKFHKRAKTKKAAELEAELQTNMALAFESEDDEKRAIKRQLALTRMKEIAKKTILFLFAPSFILVRYRDWRVGRNFRKATEAQARAEIQAINPGPDD